MVMNLPTTDRIADRGERHKGDVHITNYYRLALHSATLYAEEFISGNIKTDDTSLATDLARGKRALRPDKIEYVTNQTLIYITDSIYHTIAYILECKKS